MLRDQQTTGSDPSGPASPAGPLVVHFREISAADIALVGGKGANLGELAGAGFPVPAGFCVTTAAFRAFLAQEDGRVADEVYTALETIGQEDVEAARRVGAGVRARLVGLPVPPEVREAVVAVWHDLGDATVAVRSSATAEDLPDASFAGQQDTFLNVRGEAALVDAVRACWVSLFTDRAILYRAKNGFDHRHVGLSVVVQEMVLPEVSGILFTADPVSGDRQVVSIDAGFGLGEGLVAGLVSADLYRVDKRTGQLLEARIADKALAVRADPAGGTRHEPLAEAQRRAPALSEDQAIELAALGARIERHYGRPQDIEWSIDAGGRVYILQARPITSLFPLPEPPPTDEAPHVYVSFGHAQVMTDAMRPLGRSVIRTMVPFGKDGPPAAENPFATSAGGRIYLDVTPLMYFAPARHVLPRVLVVADPLIAAALAQVVERPAFLAGEKVAARTVRGRDVAGRVGPILAEAQKWLWLRRPEDAVFVLGATCDGEVARARAAIEAAPPGAPRVLAARERLGTAFERFLPELPGAIAAGMLARVLLLRLGGDPREVDALLRGFAGNIATEMDLEVGDLADLARSAPEVRARLTAGDPMAAIGTLDTVPGGEAFLAAWTRFLDRYGVRGPSEIDATRPRWADDPSSLAQVVAGSLRGAEAGAHRAHHRRMVQEGEGAASRLVAAARRGPLGPVRAAIVGRLARVVRGMFAIREHPKFMLIRILALVRAAVLEAAGMLVAAGRLDAAEDVWFLALPELGAALDDPALELRAAVAERRRAHARHAALRPPRVMTSDGEIPEVRHDAADLPPGAMRGNAASAGVVEGVAHVVRDPTTEVLEPGEILVAPFTDPGWTPLFLNAAGLVTEVGGLMTHGSVVAREYGIPAVVGVEEATSRIRTGQRVEVDGDRGIVRVVAEPEEGEPHQAEAR